MAKGPGIYEYVLIKTDKTYKLGFEEKTDSVHVFSEVLNPPAQNQFLLYDTSADSSQFKLCRNMHSYKVFEYSHQTAYPHDRIHNVKTNIIYEYLLDSLIAKNDQVAILLTEEQKQKLKVPFEQSIFIQRSPKEGTVYDPDKYWSFYSYYRAAYKDTEGTLRHLYIDPSQYRKILQDPFVLYIRLKETYQPEPGQPPCRNFHAEAAYSSPFLDLMP